MSIFSKIANILAFSLDSRPYLLYNPLWEPIGLLWKTRDNQPLFLFFPNMTKPPYWQESLAIFSRLSGWVLLPLIAGVFLGRWLDKIYSSDPKWFLIVTGVAFVVSMIGLIVQAKKEFKKFSK